MELHVVDTGFFKLDGGAMFGVVPKVLWSKLEEPDEQNLCTWAMRCLLVVTDDRKILIDTGIGDKQSEKFFSHFHPHGSDSLRGSIARLGYQSTDITDVILTHLHFDHVGGAVIRDGENTYNFVHHPGRHLVEKGLDRRHGDHRNTLTCFVYAARGKTAPGLSGKPQRGVPEILGLSNR